MPPRLVTAIIVVFLISSSTSFFFGKDPIGYIKWFVGATALQFILQYIVTLVLDARLGVQIKKLEQENILLLSKTEQPATCPCHVKNVQQIPILFDEQMKYKCNRCNKEISAYLDITTALTTTPVPASELDTNLAKISQQINEHTNQTD